MSKSSLRQMYRRHYDLVDRCGISVSQMTTDMFHLSVFSSFMTYHRVCNQINTTGATSGTGTNNFFPEHLSSPPFFCGVRVTRSLVVCVCFVDRCLSVCSFIFWPLCCQCFFDLRILITSLWYLRSTSSDYPFGILDLQILITPLVYSNSPFFFFFSVRNHVTVALC